jgi:hypothetical protein
MAFLLLVGRDPVASTRRQLLHWRSQVCDGIRSQTETGMLRSCGRKGLTWTGMGFSDALSSEGSGLGLVLSGDVK